jgi:hypothetical protein
MLNNKIEKNNKLKKSNEIKQLKSTQVKLLNL